MLLAVIEGVGITFQKMLAGSTKLEVSATASPPICHVVSTNADRANDAVAHQVPPPPPTDKAFA